jgi:2-desacetyl-2-hydroxyethyl bacteriochlorophyllide A dehydrogenase
MRQGTGNYILHIEDKRIMRAIVNTAPGVMAWQELPTPTPGTGQVLIRTGACGICATDIKMIAGWDRTQCPCIPGHEWAGTVDAVGPDVDRNLVGRRCVAENVLSDGGEVGFEHPGGYGEFLLTEAKNVQLLPSEFPFELAALIEPLAVAVHGTERLRIQDPSRALVFGDGIIGLFFVAMLHRAGIQEIVVVGSRPARLTLAEQLGAAKIINYHQAGGDLPGAIRSVGGKPFPNIVEASGSSAAIQAALASVARCGHLLLVGDHTGERADFPWNLILHQEMELIGSNASAGAWPETVRLAISGELPLARFVSHRFPVADYAQAIELTRQRQNDVVKIVLEWPNA